MAVAEGEQELKSEVQQDQIQRLAEKLRRLEDEGFYGEVTLRIKAGKIRVVDIRRTEVWDDPC